MASLAIFNVDAQNRNDKTKVQRQRQETTKKIQQNTRRLEQNRAATAKKLRELSIIEGEIKTLNINIAVKQASIDSLQTVIEHVTDTIADYNSRLDNLSSKYASALKHQQGSFRNISSLAYLFASHNVSEAVRKYRALKDFAKWRSRKALEIESLKERLTLRQQELRNLEQKQIAASNQLEEQKKELEVSQKQNKVLVDNLTKKGKEIRGIIDTDRKQLQKLDEQLEKLIAEEEARLAEERRLEEERRKAEEERLRLEEQKRLEEEQRLLAQQEKENKNKKKSKKDKTDNTQSKSSTKKDAPVPKDDKPKTPVAPSTSTTARTATQIGTGFLASKGNLPFPVDGRHVVVREFGRQKHPSLPMIETDNPGIDISVSKGAHARVIYEGVVSAIFKQPGYNNVVMVRHGDYLTIYANLSDVSVKKGDRIGAGTDLGRISIDEDDTQGRSILHFEIRHEKEKENPSLWLRR